MEIAVDAKFIYVYVVQKKYIPPKGYMYHTPIPSNIVEVYLTEHEANARAEELKLNNDADEFYCTSKMFNTKQLGITHDNGSTVTVVDFINTFSIKTKHDV